MVPHKFQFVTPPVRITHQSLIAGAINGSSGYLKDDSLMCWAVSAANVIAWWQEQNNIKSEYDYSTIPQGKDVHQTFVAVFDNVGGAIPRRLFNGGLTGLKTGV